MTEPLEPFPARCPVNDHIEWSATCLRCDAAAQANAGVGGNDPRPTDEERIAARRIVERSSTVVLRQAVEEAAQALARARRSAWNAGYEAAQQANDPNL